jgi:hypothetical protein
MNIQSAEPGDLEALRQLEQRARLLALMEGQDPDEKYEAPHPQLAGIKVTHIAWHVFARRLVTTARMLTALKHTEESAAQAAKLAGPGQ